MTITYVLVILSPLILKVVRPFTRLRTSYPRGRALVLRILKLTLVLMT